MPLELANPSKCSTRAADGVSEVKTLWFVRCSREYPAEIQAILQQLEVIPTLKTGEAESIDVPAVIRRHPQVALIDGLAYENPPGSPNAHRWQDVEQLLEAGISVITTVNLQYLEKLRDEVERITGKRAPYSIPRGFLDSSADEIVVVDAPAIESLLHGATPADRAGLLAEQHKLSRLRELALLVAASVVDHQLESYLRSHGVRSILGRAGTYPCLYNSAIQRCPNAGKRSPQCRPLPGRVLCCLCAAARPFARKIERFCNRILTYARQLGAQVEVLNGLNATDAILKFARQKGITQIFIGHSMREGRWRRLWSNSIERLIRSAEGIDVVIYPH